MKACIFLGPSLPVATAREFLPDAIFLPPVQQGDLFAAVQVNVPSIIGIIDGYFQQHPAVWHKEILWTMSQGIHVYGAASMGALRAAELERFGMVGIGAIFEAFRDGALPPFQGLVDDDEVAVIHGPPETEYLAVSEALVNIRHTLAAALSQQVIDQHTHDELIKQARLIHFSERSYSRLLTQGHACGLSSKSLKHVEDWLPEGRIDQKRIDAVLLLKRVAEQMQQAHSPMQVQFNFEETEIWRDAVADMRSKQDAFKEPETLEQAIIDELRLDTENYLKIKQSALLHYTLDTDEKKSYRTKLEYSGRNTDQTVSEHSRRQIADDYRRANSLFERDSVDHWLRKNDMEVADFDDMINHESRFRSVLNTPDEPAIINALIARLRLSGDYPALARRAREKLAVLARFPANTMADAQLLFWHFRQQRKQDIPENIASYASDLGLHDETQLIELLRREHLFLSKRTVDAKAISGDGLQIMEQSPYLNTNTEYAEDVYAVDLNAIYKDSGTRFRVYPQAPVLESIEDPETIWVSKASGTIGPGPADQQMYVLDAIDKQAPYEPPYFPPYSGAVHAPALPDVYGHFDYLSPGTREFIATHMYAVTRRVLDVWEIYFKRPIRWHFEEFYERLELIPQLSWDNAQSGFGFIESGYRENSAGDLQLFSLNFDVLAHEIGHSIIYSEVGTPVPATESPEYFGFQESAADMTALIAVLHFDSVVDRLLHDTHGNLYALNELNRIAELSEVEQIRIASNDRRMSDYVAGWEKEHQLSQPLTGALFDVLVEIYQQLLIDWGLINHTLADATYNALEPDIDEALIQSGFDLAFAGQHEQFKKALLLARDYTGTLLAETWTQLSAHHLKYVDVGHALLDADQQLGDGQFHNQIFDCFWWREIGRVEPGPKIGEYSTQSARSCR